MGSSEFSHTTGLTYAQARELSDRAQLRGTVATVLWASGAAVTAAGLIWALVDALEPTEPQGDVRVGATVGGLSLSGRF